MSCVINPRFQIPLATEPLSLTTNNQWTQWGEIDSEVTFLFFFHNTVFSRDTYVHIYLTISMQLLTYYLMH